MLQNIDHMVFRFFNDTCHNPVLDAIMPYFTEVGTTGVFLVAVILLFFRRQGKAVCGVLLMAGLTGAYQLNHFVKAIIARPRPFMVLPDVNKLVEAGGYSCPSTHSTMAFMAAFILTKYFKRWYIFYGLAFLVAISRPYVGVHYPSDILLGGIEGTLVGYVLCWVTSSNKNGSEVS